MLRTDEKMTELEKVFIRILLHTELSEDDVMGTLSFIKTEEQIDEIVNKIEAALPDTSKQTILNIIGQVLK